MRYFFRTEYDGTLYGGWQVQPNAVSIQEKLQSAFATALRCSCSVTGAGRTDAGVHARGQGAHIDVEEQIDIRRCELSVNSLLPHDIAIYDLKKVPDDFHARFSAISRRYSYNISMRKAPLYHKRAWMLFHPVKWELISENIGHLLGTHDFATFCASGCGSDNTICSVKDVRLEKKDDYWRITIEANRFIYKMVRSVVGTLVDIGKERVNESLDSIIHSKDRSRAGETAPAYGLTLDWVHYSV